MRTYPALHIGRSKITLFALLLVATALLEPLGSHAQQDFAYIQRRLNGDVQQERVGFRSEPVLIAGYRTSRKATLRWTGLQENISHYIVERSSDGDNFKQVGMLFTSEDQKFIEHNYTDKLKTINSGRVFYRLKVVYMEGGAEYSPVVILPGYHS